MEALRDCLDVTFEGRLRSKFSPSIEITKLGFVLGAGTYLARMRGDLSEILHHDEDAEKQRLVALLSILYAQPLAAKTTTQPTAALEDWRKGDKALAHMRLVHIALPKLIDVDDAYRLFLAESLLDQGMAAHALMKALRLDQAQPDLRKYDPISRVWLQEWTRKRSRGFERRRKQCLLQYLLDSAPRCYAPAFSI